jgi:enolase
MTKEEAIETLKVAKSEIEWEYPMDYQIALDMAIKALEKEPILYKIKEQILDEANYAYADFDRYKEDILNAEPDELPNDDYRYGMHRAFDIINKHISEREKDKC